jgi:hypothetical protein
MFSSKSFMIAWDDSADILEIFGDISSSRWILRMLAVCSAGVVIGSIAGWISGIAPGSLGFWMAAFGVILALAYLLYDPHSLVTINKISQSVTISRTVWRQTKTRTLPFKRIKHFMALRADGDSQAIWHIIIEADHGETIIVHDISSTDVSDIQNAVNMANRLIGRFAVDAPPPVGHGVKQGLFGRLYQS